MTSQHTSSFSIARFLGSFVGLFLLAFAFQGCLNDDNLIGENCYDGILNNGEELVDCGGSICDACDKCENGVWDNPLNPEWVDDGSGHREQWVDCGVNCQPCATNFNGIQDPGEIGIDCGCPDCPACPELCGDGLPNGLEDDGQIDCGGPDCEVCPTCDDGEINGEETGIDCGGPDCDPCECSCDCTNGSQDGLEQYIDCGGPSCEPCEALISWYNNGFQDFGDDLAAVSLGSPELQIVGQSSSGAEVTITINEPEDGWYNGYTSQCSSFSTTGDLVEFVSSDGTSYSTENGGVVTVSISYIEAVPGGYLVGSFNGSLNEDDVTTTSLTGGQFKLPIN